MSVDIKKKRKGRLTFAIVVLVAASAGVAGGYGFKGVANHHQISDYVRTHSVRKLQIGAGGAGRFPEFVNWLNTDIQPAKGEAYMDATKPFPLPDSSFSIIFSEQVIEHLSYNEGLAMLRESYRILKPGGKVRIATPNLQTLVQLFKDPKTEETKSYFQDKLKAEYWSESMPRTISPECAILNGEMHEFGHKFIYDPKTLRESLERAGFTSIQQVQPGESDDPELRGLELRHKGMFHSMNDYETMVFQAVRP